MNISPSNLDSIVSSSCKALADGSHSIVDGSLLLSLSPAAVKLEPISLDSSNSRMEATSDTSKAERGRGKNKRVWKPYEDDALVQCLLELSHDPQFKSELGFKNKYLEQLEKMLAEKLPESRLTVDPNIQSRLKTLKAKYVCLHELLGRTGATWNDDKKQLVINKETYLQYLKSHKDAASLFEKPFPHYEALDTIFGKDRAIGKGVETFTKAINNMDSDMSIPLFNVDISDMEGHTSRMSHSPSEHKADQETDSVPRKKKMKKDKAIRDAMVNNLVSHIGAVSDHLAGFLTTMKSGIDTMNEHLATIAHTMVEESKTEARGNRIVQELLSIDGLTQHEALSAAEILLNDSTKLRVFSQLPQQMKKDYVLRLHP